MDRAVLEKLTIKEFCEKATHPDFACHLELRFSEAYGKGSVSPQEKASWANSLPKLATLLQTLPIAGHILIEYLMPLGEKRADCVLVGADASGKMHIIVIELKQWSQGRIRLNETFDMGWLTVDATPPYPTDHPCEQAHVYRAALEHQLDFGGETPTFHSLAYLHEYTESDDELLRLPHFDGCLRETYLLTRNQGIQDASLLLSQLQTESPIVERLVSPKIKYSRSFISNFSDKLNCSALFKPTAEQIQAFKNIAATLDQVEQPTCVIVKGIVGTGKTVLAMLLIRHLMERGKQPLYYARSAAIGACIRQLDFYARGHGRTEYYMVDEAHRLNKRELPQIVRDKRLTVFFIDDNQWLQPQENCRSHDIQQAAEEAGQHILEVSLVKQLRCQDAGAYIEWVDNFLNAGKITRFDSTESFEVKVVDTPHQMTELLTVRAQDNTSCRIVAGYCWYWATEQKPGIGHDIEIGDWTARWNARASYATWNRFPGLHKEVGAIYTVQGFEYDYVGVVIGEDLVYRNGRVCARRSAQQDPGLQRYMNTHSGSQEEKKATFARIIRNIYYVLMTRAKKGVFIYVVDPELRGMLRGALPDV
ncbi:hypothetical protein PS726_00143 [Pseudomonas fluorescens]|uniref:DNA/RNA helicase domain-containing protein n=1 Tax=Pseudomonas fluorescens TaxID=294 RepID=UPI00123FBD97|nr:DNA/RNA helicase domain-containing protein [Pseudomonas fluorescens]VVN66764.1 hypothetical protein PS726_00143 [Pseudomonas fluorescens]